MKKILILAILFMMIASCTHKKPQEITCELNYKGLTGIKYHQATFHTLTPFDVTKEQQKTLGADDELLKKGQFDNRFKYVQVLDCLDTVKAISKSTGWCECKRGENKAYEEELLQQFSDKLKWIDK